MYKKFCDVDFNKTSLVTNRLKFCFQVNNILQYVIIFNKLFIEDVNVFARGSNYLTLGFLDLSSRSESFDTKVGNMCTWVKLNINSINNFKNLEAIFSLRREVLWWPDVKTAHNAISFNVENINIKMHLFWYKTCLVVLGIVI